MKRQPYRVGPDTGTFDTFNNHIHSRVGEVSHGGAPLLTVLQDPGEEEQDAGGTSHKIYMYILYMLLFLFCFWKPFKIMFLGKTHFHRNFIASVCCCLF